MSEPVGPKPADENVVNTDSPEAKEFLEEQLVLAVTSRFTNRKTMEDAKKVNQ